VRPINNNDKIQQIDHQCHFDVPNLLLVRGDDTIKLEAIQGRLLSCFLLQPNVVITRAELIEQVWSSQYVSDNAINRSISSLRKSLGGDPKRYITTVPKIGYCFNTVDNPAPNIAAGRSLRLLRIKSGIAGICGPRNRHPSFITVLIPPAVPMCH
jgi:DNA-binding winged helix-turn-helix (wHTH) protein